MKKMPVASDSLLREDSPKEAYEPQPLKRPESPEDPCVGFFGGLGIRAYRVFI